MTLNRSLSSELHPLYRSHCSALQNTALQIHHSSIRTMAPQSGVWESLVLHDEYPGLPLCIIGLLGLLYDLHLYSAFLTLTVLQSDLHWFTLTDSHTDGSRAAMQGTS